MNKLSEDEKSSDFFEKTLDKSTGLWYYNIRKRKEQQKMVIMSIRLPNRTEYRVMESLWAANLVAINLIRNHSEIEYIRLYDKATGETKTYKRG